MSRKTILVVEDEPEINLMVGELLGFSGFQVRSAMNGQEALEELQKGLPDLILLDMRMPIMNGWEFSRRFRELYGPKVPIVVLTAAEDAEKRAKEIGAQGFIGKPFDIDHLVTLVNRMVGQEPARTEALK